MHYLQSGSEHIFLEDYLIVLASKPCTEGAVNYLVRIETFQIDAQDHMHVKSADSDEAVVCPALAD